MKHATYLCYSVVGQIWPLSPGGNKAPSSPHLPISFVPTIQLWKISEGHRSGSTLWCLYWLAPFPFYFFFFFFFNNQSSRKSGELTAWQQQRNSLEKLRWILLRFQALRQESQRSNRLLVVFNHFFCGTILVPETNLSVRHEGAWEHRPSEWRLWFGDYFSNINYFFLTSLWQDGNCPSWRGQWTVLCHCFYLKCYLLKTCFKIINSVHKTLLQKILK